MGRPKKSIVHNYFDYDEIQRTSTCKVENCSYVMKGNHAGNLMHHLNKRHGDLYENITPLRSQAHAKKQEKSKNSLLICCWNLVKKYELPMEIFDDVNFKSLISLGLGETVINAKAVLMFMNKNTYGHSSSNAENGNDDSSEEILIIKGEKSKCTCSNNDGDDNFVHNSDCPTSKSQAYWNYFEVNTDTACCLLCQEQLKWDNIAELKAHMTDHHQDVTFRDDDKEFEHGHRSDASREDVAAIYLEDNPDDSPKPRKRRRSENTFEQSIQKDTNDAQVTPQIVKTIDSFGQYVADLLKLLPIAKSIKLQLQIIERLLKEAKEVSGLCNSVT